ncbi:MAG: AraC family transcriptional regulator [Saprospiraceae bacterium]|nr:AraC family transcriptional regulator [Saprospiraceae bacterium]
MKLRLIDRSLGHKRPFVVKEKRYPNFLKIWHYHPELELVVIKESVGTRFVGDGIEKFRPNEVVLIGKNLPHMWQNDEEYFQPNSGLMASALSIHFREDFVGSEFLQHSSAQHLLELFARAKRGIKFNNLRFPVQSAIQQLMQEKDDFQKLIKLLLILHQLAKHSDTSFLSSEGYSNTRISEVSDSIHEYIFENFNRPIRLEDIAAIAGMNTSAFSRYFKRIHRKTFSRYLIEIRIGYACKLLMENKKSISSICYESGFNNLSNFNKQFLKVKQMNPSQYIRLHR